MENNSDIAIYTAPDGQIQLDVKLDKETVWLTQNQLALLMGTKKAAITKHISNILKAGKLDEISTVSKMETVQKEGKRTTTRSLTYYNLDMIISVGYCRQHSRRTYSYDCRKQD